MRKSMDIEGPQLGVKPKTKLNYETPSVARGPIAAPPNPKDNELTNTYLKSRKFLRYVLSKILPQSLDVEDIMQEAYLRTYDAARKTAIKSPRSFLFKVARNLALNELSRASNRITSYIEDAAPREFHDDKVSVETEVAERAEFAEFEAAVSQLPSQCRKVFVLRKVYGHSQKEIADMLDISVSTVEKHVINGLVKCRKHMRTAGYRANANAPKSEMRYETMKKNSE